MVCFMAGAQFIFLAGWRSADPCVEHQLLPVLVPLGLQVELMGALKKIHAEEEERFQDWELIAKCWQKQDEERIEEVVRRHEENLDLKNLIQDWEEWYEEKEEARQGEVTQVQEISSSPEVLTVEEVGTRLDTASMWHGRWMMLIAMSHNDFLVSGAGWTRHDRSRPVTNGHN